MTLFELENNLHQLKISYESSTGKEISQLISGLMDIFTQVIFVSKSNVEENTKQVSDWLTYPANACLVEFFDEALRKENKNLSCHSLLIETYKFGASEMSSFFKDYTKLRSIDEVILMLTVKRKKASFFSEKLYLDSFIAAFTTVKKYHQEANGLGEKPQFLAVISPILTSSFCIFYYPQLISFLFLLFYTSKSNGLNKVNAILPETWTLYLKKCTQALQDLSITGLELSSSAVAEIVNLNYSAHHYLLRSGQDLYSYLLKAIGENSEKKALIANSATLFNLHFSTKELKGIVYPLQIYCKDQANQINSPQRIGAEKSKLIGEAIQAALVIDQNTLTLAAKITGIEQELTKLMSNAIIVGSGKKAVNCIKSALIRCKIYKNQLDGEPEQDTITPTNQ